MLKGEPAEALKDSIHASDALHRMILNLLDVSRSEDGLLRTRPSDIDLLRIAREVRDEARHRSEQDGKTIVVDAVESEVRIHADAALVRRVMENLIDNSLKYTPAGGEIRLELRRAAEGGATLRVRDQGPGVPEAYRTSVFDKYAQLDRDTARRARSSRGLGLAFCRLAVEAHGGRIWIEDNQPTGAVFCVTLPAMASTERQTAA
jgi:signal transduction histidine kinase